jgi:hypothetical protein
MMSSLGLLLTPNSNKSPLPSSLEKSLAAAAAASSSSAKDSKRAYTTEIVKALGGNVGDVIQDVQCSYQRQSGRLYISTEGLFFYSNLFGFEKRIGIKYEHAVQITMIRTTSLLIKTGSVVVAAAAAADGEGGSEREEYIFSSFDNRELVLDTIKLYHTKLLGDSQQNEIIQNSSDDNIYIPQDSSSSSSSLFSSVEVNNDSTYERSNDETTNDRDDAMSVVTDVITTPAAPRRRRIREVFDVSSDNTNEGRKNIHSKSTSKAATTATTAANSANNIIEDKQSINIINNNSDDAESKWTRLQQHTSTWEFAIADLNLKTTKTTNPVQEFFDLFLMNTSTNSLYEFLCDIGETDINISSWQEEEDRNISIITEKNDSSLGKILTRSIEYTHKAGLAIVKVTRNQSYQIYGTQNSCVTTITTVQGIRGVASDVFSVEDKWFIESLCSSSNSSSSGTENVENGITLNVKFHVNFHKSTMLKSLIQNRAMTEAKEFYSLYAKFLMNPKTKGSTSIITQDESNAPSSSNLNTKSTARSGVMGYESMFVHICILLIAALAYVIFQLKQHIMSLEDDIHTINQRLLELENVKSASFTHIDFLEE